MDSPKCVVRGILMRLKVSSWQEWKVAFYFPFSKTKHQLHRDHSHFFRWYNLNSTSISTNRFNILTSCTFFQTKTHQEWFILVMRTNLSTMHNRPMITMKTGKLIIASNIWTLNFNSSEMKKRNKENGSILLHDFDIIKWKNKLLMAITVNYEKNQSDVKIAHWTNDLVKKTNWNEYTVHASSGTRVAHTHKHTLARLFVVDDCKYNKQCMLAKSSVQRSCTNL